MSIPRRIRIGGAIVAVKEIALGFLLLDTVLGPYFFACAAASLAVALTMARSLSPPPPDEDDDGPGGGGGEDLPPEPPWWPEFERDLATYQRERRQKTPTA